MADAVRIEQIRCGNCGAVGQWAHVRIETRLQAKTRGVYQSAPYNERDYLELECAACGVYTVANPHRVKRTPSDQ